MPDRGTQCYFTLGKSSLIIPLVGELGLVYMTMPWVTEKVPIGFNSSRAGKQRVFHTTGLHTLMLKVHSPRTFS